MYMDKKLSTWYRKYRIQKDGYSGNEVRIWRMWFPFWIQLGGSNTFRSIEGAEQYARDYHNNKAAIKYL